MYNYLIDIENTHTRDTKPVQNQNYSYHLIKYFILWFYSLCCARVLFSMFSSFSHFKQAELLFSQSVDETLRYCSISHRTNQLHLNSGNLTFEVCVRIWIIIPFDEIIINKWNIFLIRIVCCCSRMNQIEWDGMKKNEEQNVQFWSWWNPMVLNSIKGI